MLSCVRDCSSCDCEGGELTDLRGWAGAVSCEKSWCYLSLDRGLVLLGAETAEKSGRAASIFRGSVDERLRAFWNGLCSYEAGDSHERKCVECELHIDGFVDDVNCLKRVMASYGCGVN